MDPDWDEYKRRVRSFRLATLLAPLWILPGWLIRSFLIRCGWDPEGAWFAAVAFPMMAIIAVAQVRRIRWPCPRCGQSFHVCWWYSNTFARRCVHCGLPKWTSKSKQAPSDLA